MNCAKLIVAAAVLSFASVMSAQQRIAVVDFEKLVRLHPNTANDKKQLEATLKEYNAKKEQLQDAAVAARKAFEEAAREAANPALSDSAKRKAEAAAIEKRKEAIEADRSASEKVRDLQRDLNEQEMSMLRRTSNAIDKEISAYAKEHDIDIVLQLPSRLGAGSGVVYSKEDADITAAIMKRMDIEEPEAEAAADDDEEEEAPAAATKKADDEGEAPAATEKETAKE